MTLTKEKKNAATKAVKLPKKTVINLAQRESRKKDIVTIVVGLTLIVIMASCVAKFGVLDQLERLNRAEAEYNQAHRQYLLVQEAVADYPMVEERYRTYSRKWLESGEEEGLVTVDRVDILDMMEEYLRPYGLVNSADVTGTMLTVNMSGMNLREISAMLARVEQHPIVAKAFLRIASTEDEAEDAELDFTLTIALQPKEVAE